MLLDEFVSEIRQIVQSSGFENLLAFAYYPGQRWGRGLGELPPESEPEAAILKWADIWAMEGEEFLVALLPEIERRIALGSAGRKGPDPR